MSTTELTTPLTSSALGQATIVSSPDVVSRERAVRQRIADNLQIRTDQVDEHAQVMWLTLEGNSYGRESVISVLHELSLATFQPGQSRYIVFTQAHRLTPEAANALLKVMEEPPLNVYFLLLVDTVAHVMPTLRSRSRVWSLQVRSASNGSQMGSDFLASSLPARFGAIARLKDRADLLELFQATLAEVHRTNNYLAASWLVDRASYAAGSGNLRLLMEAFAISPESSLK